jgi:alpha-D-ribose 1-methylphosphonate 5-triphosphate synthase subunit PhnG
MDSRGWTRSESDLQHIRFLDWVYDNTRDGTLPSGRTYMEETGIGEDTLEALVARASQRGLLHVHGGMGGLGASSVSLTDAGVTEVLERRERRQDRRARAAACRDAVLDWMYEQRLIGTNNPHMGMIHGAPQGHFEGDLFMEPEVNEATVYLREHGLIRGTRSSGGGVARPTLTAEGIDCADRYDSSVPAYLSRHQTSGGTTFHTHFNAPVTGQVGVGTNVTQTQHQGIDPETLQKLLEDVREAAEQVNTGEAQYLLTYADTIQAEVTAESPNADVIRGSSDRLKQIAGKVGNAGLTSSVSALVTYLARTLGGG